MAKDIMLCIVFGFMTYLFYRSLTKR